MNCCILWQSLWQSPDTLCLVINPVSRRPIVLLDAIRLIKDLVGRRVVPEHHPRHPADVKATWAGIDKEKQLLGWQVQCPFEEGVAQLIAWYYVNHEWAEDASPWWADM